MNEYLLVKGSLNFLRDVTLPITFFWALLEELLCIILEIFSYPDGSLVICLTYKHEENVWFWMTPKKLPCYHQISLYNISLNKPEVQLKPDKPSNVPSDVTLLSFQFCQFWHVKTFRKFHPIYPREKLRG